MKVHVLIGGTQGPVWVRDLGVEKDALDNVVCIDGTHHPIAHVEDGYGQFWKQLIRKSFGPNHWRLDLSEKIERGDSWMLGVYLAHLVERAGVLGHGNDVEPGDHVLWATGCVAPKSGEVRSIDELETKLLLTNDLFHQLHEQGVTVTGFAPTENVEALPDSWREDNGIQRAWMELEAVSSIEAPVLTAWTASLEIEGAPLPETNSAAYPETAPETAPDPEPSPGPRRSVPLIIGAGLVLAAGLGLAWQFSPSWLPKTTPETAPLTDEQLVQVAPPDAPEQTERTPANEPRVTAYAAEVVLHTASRSPQGRCDDGNLTVRRLVPDATNAFATASWRLLCGVALETAGDAEPFAVRLVGRTAVRLTRSGERWAYDVPEVQAWVERQALAYVLPQTPVDDAALAVLTQRLKTVRPRELEQDPRALQRVLAEQKIEAAVYHQRWTL